MSVCTFLASDVPLPEVRPSREYPLKIDLDSGTIYDGGADDNFFLLPFQNLLPYTERQYGVCLEWRFTEGRAEALLQYMRDQLQDTDSLEFWHVWLIDYWEYEDRPVMHRYSASIDELTPEDLRELSSKEIWTNPDRPSFYCLTIMA